MAINEGITCLFDYGSGFVASKVTPEVGRLSEDMATGDFNQDGHIDLAVIDRRYADEEGLDYVHIFLGDGQAGFAMDSSVSVGDDPLRIVASDFNQDECLDLAVTTIYSPSVSLLIGDGSGSFIETVVDDVGSSSPEGIKTGNFKEDAFIDLVIVNKDYVSILLGAGPGEFSPAVQYNAGTRPRDVISGDFDEDGHTDLAVPSDSGLKILLGDGLGSFGEPVSFIVGDSPFAIATADFNKDGHLDLAVANDGSDIGVVLGVGDGSCLSRIGHFPDSAFNLAGLGRPRSAWDTLPACQISQFQTGH